MSKRFYEWTFLTGAIWNWIVAATMILGGDRFRAALGMGPALEPLLGQLFATLVAIFGLAFWIVGRDISRNHGIVLLGILGKVSVFALFVGHALAGNVPFATLPPVVVDLAYGALFLSFYVRRGRLLGGA